MAMNRLQLAPQLAAFHDKAVELGARHMAGIKCVAREIPAPIDDKAPSSGIAGSYTQGCGGETLFALPAEGLNKPDEAIVCAVDDMAYRFPKYTEPVDPAPYKKP